MTPRRFQQGLCSVRLTGMVGAAREKVTAALRTHAPDLADAGVRELGHGLDNAAFVVGDLVVRVGGRPDVVREARLLAVVGRHVSLPVPQPRFVDEDRGVLAYPLVPGTPLIGRAPPQGSAYLLGRFLRELHGVEHAAVVDLVPTEEPTPGEWLQDLAGPPGLLDLLRAAVPPPARNRVLAHADLGAEHLLERRGELTGVIDWSDAALTDPALDFARLYRDFGPRFLDDTLRAYGDVHDADQMRARIQFFARCAALEDLAYGRDHGRPEYAHAAERSLAWLFPSAR